MSIVTLNNRALKDATAVGTTTSIGDLVFIKRQTASDAASIEFKHGTSSVVLDSTYKNIFFSLTICTQ